MSVMEDLKFYQAENACMIIFRKISFYERCFNIPCAVSPESFSSSEQKNFLLKKQWEILSLCFHVEPPPDNYLKDQ